MHFWIHRVSQAWGRMRKQRQGELCSLPHHHIGQGRKRWWKESPIRVQGGVEHVCQDFTSVLLMQAHPFISARKC